MSLCIIKGDCLERMKSLPARSVDCFICDLPYGQLAGSKRTEENIKKYKYGNSYNLCEWDVKIDLNEFWTQVKRLCKNDNVPVIMFCNTKFGFELYNSNPLWFRYDLVWNKNRGISFLLANKMPMKSHEMIYVFSKKGAYYKRIDVKTDKQGYIKKVEKDRESLKSRQYGIMKDITVSQIDGSRCPLSVLDFNGKAISNLHPTEKPMELYKWLLERYCPVGGTVLDPTAGSFNSVIVAKELGLHGIGIEKDTNYFCKAIQKANNLNVSKKAKVEIKENVEEKIENIITF